MNDEMIQQVQDLIDAIVAQRDAALSSAATNAALLAAANRKIKEIQGQSPEKE